MQFCKLKRNLFCPGQRRWHHQLDNRRPGPTHRCLCGDREWMPAAERMDLWRASDLQSPERLLWRLGARRQRGARCRRQLYMCVRRQLRNINYEVRFTRSGSFLICAERKTLNETEGMSHSPGFPAGDPKRRHAPKSLTNRRTEPRTVGSPFCEPIIECSRVDAYPGRRRPDRARPSPQACRRL